MQVKSFFVSFSVLKNQEDAYTIENSSLQQVSQENLGRILAGLQKFWNPNRSACPMTSYEHEFDNPK